MVLKKFISKFLMLVPLLIFACSQGPYNGPMGGWGHMMGYGYGGGFMWIIFLIVIGILIYFLIQASKSVTVRSSLNYYNLSFWRGF